MRVTFPTYKTAVRWSFFLYVLLLVVEGGLRKWFLPGLATPLLVIRDPLAALTLAYALYKGRFPYNGYVVAAVGLTLVSFVHTVLLGHGHLPVAVFGARILILHFPLIFVYARELTREDVERVGDFFVYSLFLLVPLIYLQNNNPQSAWVNWGVGADPAGSGFEGGALGFYRPAGLYAFAFNSVLHISLAQAWVFARWLRPGRHALPTLIGATICLIIVIPLSISRQLVVQTLLSLLMLGPLGVVSPTYSKKLTRAVVGLAILVLIAFQLPVFTDFILVVQTRFDLASNAEGGIQSSILDRVFGNMYRSFINYQYLGTFGYGLGAGTNVGSVILSGGKEGVFFLAAEDEWSRINAERGVYVAFGIILMRTVLTVRLGWESLRTFVRSGDPLAWVLFAITFMNTLFLNVGVPSSLGFVVLEGALLVYLINEPGRGVAPAASPRATRRPAPGPTALDPAALDSAQ